MTGCYIPVKIFAKMSAFFALRPLVADSRVHRAIAVEIDRHADITDQNCQVAVRSCYNPRVAIVKNTVSTIARRIALCAHTKYCVYHDKSPHPPA